MARWIVCSEPGCAELHQGSGRCPECRRESERARPTKQARGYDRAFENAKRLPAYRDATHCTQCGEPFTTTNPKTAGHSVAIRDGGQGSAIEPQCRRCNYGWRRTGL